MSNKPNLKKNAPRPRQVAAKRRPLWQSPLLWVGALIVVALVVAIVLSVGGGDDDGDTLAAGETAPVELFGDPLPPLAIPDPVLGRQVPTISAQLLGGDRVVVGEDDTARVYGFFAHWCPHCQAELPRTVDYLASTPPPEGVEVVAVATSTDSALPNYPPSEWFAREAWTQPVILDDEEGSIAEAFGLTGFPYWVVADADGKVVTRQSGELSTDDLAALIASADPAAAAVAASS